MSLWMWVGPVCSRVVLGLWGAPVAHPAACTAAHRGTWLPQSFPPNCHINARACAARNTKASHPQLPSSQPLHPLILTISLRWLSPACARAPMQVGVFRMDPAGLHAMDNPSAHFLSARSASAVSSAVAVTMDGTRLLAMEVQVCVGSLGTCRAQVAWCINTPYATAHAN